jgi:hypothetical protein
MVSNFNLGEMKKLIIIKWVKLPKEPKSFYKEEMRVIWSTHPKYTEGTRFDFGFFHIATKEGFSILSLPI